MCNVGKSLVRVFPYRYTSEENMVRGIFAKTAAGGLMLQSNVFNINTCANDSLRMDVRAIHVIPPNVYYLLGSIRGTHQVPSEPGCVLVVCFFE